MLFAASVLTVPDYAVIGIYLVATVVIGIHLGRRIKDGNDFFLAGRQLPWWAIGMSLVATDIGGTDIIGVGGAAYKHGLAVANFEWIGCVPAMIVGAFVFIPFFYRAGVYTIPEFLERRYNGAVRAVVACCWLAFMACNLGVMLLASAKMMSTLIAWDEVTCVLVTATLVGAYTMVGGLAAVVYTDMIQCVVMIVGCLLILVMGLIEVGGVGALRQRLADAEQRAEATQESDAELSSGEDIASVDTSSTEMIQHEQLILPVDTPSPFPWPGILVGLALILSPGYWIGNQAIVQRSLGARSEFEAKASYIWGALLKNLIPLIVAVPGLIAVALLPDLSDGDAAIPSLVGQLLPAGLRGLFVAAFLAALMSSIDSYLNSAATLVTSDLYKRFFRPDLTDKKMLAIGRWTTLALVLWAVFFAFLLTQMQEGSGLYAIFQTLISFFQGPAFAILLWGICWRRATSAGALIGLVAGIATALCLYLLNQPAIYEALGWPPLFQISEPFLYFSIWAFAVTSVVLVVVSLCTKPPSADRLLFTLRKNARESHFVQEQP